MELLSTSTTLPTTSYTLGDMSDAVTSLPFDRIGSALDSVTPDLDEVGDFAAAAARTSRRVGERTIRTTVRVVRDNQRLTAGLIAGLIVTVALAMVLKQRKKESPEAVTRT